MKKLFFLMAISIMFFTTKAQIASGIWTDVASTSLTGTAPRASGISFVIGNYLYIGFGQDASNAPQNDIWKWDITNLTAGPTQVTNNLPNQLIGRVGAFVFVINGKAYIGAGYSGSGWLNGFFEFNPLNTVSPFTQKTNVPANFMFGTAFALNGFGYAGMGNNGNASANNSTWFKYNPTTDTWTTLGAAPTLFGPSSFITGTGATAKGYVCFGSTSHSSGVESNKIYEYDPALDSWTEITLSGTSAHPSARIFAGAFTVNNQYGVVVGGGAYGGTTPIYDDAYAFDPATSSWITLNPLGYAPASDLPRKYIMYASDPASKSGYISGGTEATAASGVPRYPEIINFTYSDPSGIEDLVGASFTLYPNPTTDLLYVETSGTPVTEVNIYNTTGSLVMAVSPLTANCQLSTASLPTGVYIAEIKTKEASVKRRWVKM